MPAMTDGRSGRNRWLPAFVVSLAALAGALVALGFAVISALGDDDNAADPGETPAPPTELDTPLRAWVEGGLSIDLSALPEGTFEPASNAVDADVVIGTGGEGEPFLAARYVPVTALHAGVDELTAAQLSGLLTGQFTDWSEVEGIAGPVVPAIVEADRDWLAGALGVEATALAGAQPFPDHEALVAAMTENSGMVAVVPMRAINVTVRALALDGIDPVRGAGDVASWPLVREGVVRGITDDGEEVAEALAGALEAPLPNVTTIMGTGDILLNRCTLARLRDSGDWGGALRGDIGEYLASADLALGHYDGSIQDLYPVPYCEETTNLSSPPEVIESMTVAGIDGLSLATNHIADCGFAPAGCGMETLQRTIELVEAAGIRTYGAGDNLEEALAPEIFEVNGLRIGVLGFDDVAASFLEATADSPGTAPLDDSYEDEIAAGLYYTPFFAEADMLHLERFTQRIRELDAQVDVVVVQVETGTEDVHRPSDRSVKALRAAVDAGADIIIGNQAHHVQAAELYNGVFIPYALGNFIYDQVHTPEHTQNFILETTLWDDRVVNVKLVPTQIEEMYRPVRATGALRTKILSDVWDAADEMVAEGR